MNLLLAKVSVISDDFFVPPRKKYIIGEKEKKVFQRVA
eukprot:SAG11_NODE_1896_length_4091_cov_48.963176_2_plen_38_part_00